MDVLLLGGIVLVGALGLTLSYRHPIRWEED